jgi:hypothetical protein
MERFLMKYKVGTKVPWPPLLRPIILKNGFQHYIPERHFARSKSSFVPLLGLCAQGSLRLISQLAGSLGGYGEANPNQLLLLPQNSEARPQKTKKVELVGNEWPLLDGY